MNASFADGDAADAVRFRAAVAGALRGLSGDVLCRLATSWPAEDDLANRIVAEAIAEALDELRAEKAPFRRDEPPWLDMHGRSIQASVAA